jgi:protocatechuate 3,4-dioxygenase beta subunit
VDTSVTSAAVSRRFRTALATIVIALLATAGIVAVPSAAFAAPESGSISGIVKSSTNSAIANVRVSAIGYTWDDEFEGFDEEASAVAFTDSLGRYTLTGLAAGDYAIEFFSVQENYVTTYWDGYTDIWSSELVAVTTGELITGINAKLAKGATITGTVLGEGAVTLPAEELTITACDSYEDYLDCSYGRTQILADGSYRITNLAAGKYSVYAEYSGQGNYRTEFYPNARFEEDATTFSLKAGATATKKNFVLNAGAVIEGAVTHEGEPVPGALISAHEYDADWEYLDTEDYLRAVTTGADGRYSIGGLWPGDYAAYAHSVDADQDLAGEWFENAILAKDATVFRLGAVPSSTTADFELAAGTTLTGTVTSDQTGEALEHVDVSIYRLATATSKRGTYFAGAETNASGVYTAPALPAGSYTVEFTDYSDSSLYLSQYYGGAPLASQTTATRLAVSGDEVTASVALTRGAIYSGHVVTSGGAPLAGVSVDVASSDFEDFTSVSSVSDSAGYFTVAGLPTGTYSLSFGAYDAVGPHDELIADRTIAAPPVAQGAEPTDVGTVELFAASTVTGTITGKNGKPVRGYVVAYERLADGSLQGIDGTYATKNGVYSFDRLPVGDIYLQVHASGYPTQYAGGAATLAIAEPFTITTGGTSVTRDITLYAGGSISGTVKNAKTGRVLPGIPVETYLVGADEDLDDEGGEWASTVSSKKGTYVLPGLSSGSHQVYYNFDYETSPYATATRDVFVGDNARVTQNVSLAPLVKISGTVTVDSDYLGEVTVTAHRSGATDSDDDVTTSTNAAGKYSLYVPAGTWELMFSDQLGDRGATTWLGGTADAASSTKVVAVSKALTNRNVTLPRISGGVTGTIVSGGELEYGVAYVWNVSDGTLAAFTSWGDTDDSPFPITNLRAGDYELSLLATDGELLYEKSGVDFTVASDATIADVGEVDLGTGSELSEFYPTQTGADPTIDTLGPLSVDGQLRANPGEWSLSGETLSDDDFGYTWLRNGKVIAGASERDYTLTPGDVGKSISVRVSPIIDGQSFDGFDSATSAATGIIAAGAAPASLESPTLTGTNRVGKPLTVSTGVWDFTDGVRFSYAWTRTTTGNDPVLVGTSATYKPVAADVAADTTLAVTVTAKRVGYLDGEVTIDAGATLPSAALAQTGKSVVTKSGTVLSVTAGKWKPTGGEYSYLWKVYDSADEVVTTGDGATFDVASFPGNRITVDVTATKAGYASTTVTVSAQAAVAPVVWTADPLISGLAFVERIVRVNLDSATTTPAATSYTYQWSQNGKKVKGATKSTFAITTVGTVSVAITAHRAGYASATTTVTRDAGARLTDNPIEVVTYPSLPSVASVGTKLVANPGTYDVPGVSFTYTWLRNGVPIMGATGSSYTPIADDVDERINVIVTVSKTGSTGDTFASTTSPTVELGTAPLATKAPALTVSGKTVTKVALGKSLAIGTGTWNATGVVYGYTWQSSVDGITWTTIDGALTKKLVLDADLFESGQKIRALVTASKSGYEIATATSKTITIT